LPYSVFNHLQRVNHVAIVEKKCLSEVMAWIHQHRISGRIISTAWPAPGGQTRKPA
jgi:hypothetical protein